MAPLATAKLRTVLLALVGTALAVSLFPSAALAAPTPSPADVEAQIEAKGRALDAIVEQYNGAVLHLAETSAQAAQAATRYAVAAQRAEAARADVAALATRAYEGGTLSALSSLVAAGSPDSFLDRLTAMDSLARSQRSTMATARDASTAARADKARLDQLVASQAQQKTALAAQKTKLQSDIDALVKQRDQLRAAAAAAAKAAAAPAPAPPAPPKAGPVVPVSGRAAAVVAYARRQLGKPYVFATAGPNTFDCSGLTTAAWAAAGVHLDHYTYAQIQQTVRISRSQLAPGDLVFFYGGSHVGIYLGNNQIIHAPHPGDVVKISDIDWMGGYYTGGRPH